MQEPSATPPATSAVANETTTPAPAKASWAMRIGLLLFVVVLIGGIVALRMRNAAGPRGGAGGRGPGGEQGPAPVRTVHPELRDVPIHLEGLGTVTPLQTAVVRARVSGQLESVSFAEGQPVHAGDVIAQIDPRPFRVVLAQAQAVLARDEASLGQARVVLERDRQLHAHELLSTQDLQAQEASVASLDATVQADRASADAARLNLQYTRITAPIDGRTGLRQVDPGNLVSSSDANGIVVITSVNPIAVVFTLPQDDLQGVVERQHEAPLGVRILARDGVTVLEEGHLSVIDNRVDATTGTIRMKAEVPNEHERLWGSQLVQVSMLLETRQGVMVVPDSAVQQGPDGAFVYVIVDHHAQVRAVHVDRIVDDVAIIHDGLALTDDVVSEGQSRLRPDAEVHLESDPPPPSGAPGGAPGGAGGGGAARRGSP